MCVLSKHERDSARNYGFSRRVEIVPNGVSRPLPCSIEEVAAFRIRHNVAPGARVVLFLSRIARKKNLPLLLKSFARNIKKRSEWMLLIAGPDECGHLNDIRQLIQDLGIHHSVCYVGPVAGKEKACAFSAASLFVLPSISEGLPIAVLEAMAYGKPVLITDGWTFPISTDLQFGWRASSNECEFQEALFEAMSCSEEALAEIGSLGKSIVSKYYDWEIIGKQMLAIYQSVLSERSDDDA
jgi:glycosyltransferase involved in cell wall biosynthesis